MRASLFGLMFIVAACGAGAADSEEGATPGTSGTNTGLGCVESDLVAQCPPGSNPDLSAAATSECEGQVDVLLSGDGGSVHAACRGTGECLVVCNFQVPCDCGVDRITTEGVFCTPCSEASACGDAVCEGGEDPTTCPVDCAAVCPAGSRRCNGRDREDCNAQGQWERVACRDDQACEVGPAGVACQANSSPSGGTWPGTGWTDVSLPADPAEVYFPGAEFPCGQIGASCMALAFLDDTNVLALAGDTPGIFPIGGAQGELLPVSVQSGAVAVDLPWIVSGARQPEIFQVDTRQKRAAEAVVDDVTELTFAGVAVDAANKRGAVAFAAAGQPFVALYALEDGRIEGMLRYAQSNQTRAAVSLAFSPDGKLLAELRPEGLCIVWNVEERKHTRLIELEGEPNRPFPLEATQVAFTRGLGPYLVLTSQMGTELWDLDTPERLRRDTHVSGRFTLSPDGRILATRADGGLGLYYLESFEHIRTVSVPPVHIGRPGVDLVTFPHGLFSADGRRLAGGHLIFTGYEE